VFVLPEGKSNWEQAAVYNGDSAGWNDEEAELCLLFLAALPRELLESRTSSIYHPSSFSTSSDCILNMSFMFWPLYNTSRPPEEKSRQSETGQTGSEITRKKSET
jgi:hypothetical protein